MPAAGSDLRQVLLTVMQRGARSDLSDPDFNSLALRAFHHQYEHNIPYRGYCERRERTPATVTDWSEIPAVPTAAFKEVPFVAGDARAARLIFRTSGTTRGAEQRGVHYILDPALYQSSLLPAFERYVLADGPPLRMLSLVPSAAEQPESSLSYMITVIMNELVTVDSRFLATVRDGLQVAALRDALAQSVAEQVPVCLLGTSLAFAHFLDAVGDLHIELPAGSRLMDTGGFKGESVSITAHELRDRYAQMLGLDRRLCINEYGMTELCSQYYDARLAGDDAVKQGPPWLRARVVDPDTLAALPRGRTGILQHFDLANLDSVCAVLTEDLAYETAEGFVLLGRVPGATPRGCSIAMDILLSDARGSS